MFQVDEARPDPGRVTIRRLNRMEYQYTVRDLFGIDLDLAQELPPDDTAFGFDNIGDAQTLSPALLETYLTLAEKVVADAIVEDGPRHPQVRVRPDQFRPKAADEKSNRAEQAAAVELKHDGKYQVELQFGVGGWQEYGGEYELTVTLGGQEVVGEEDDQRRRQQDVHPLRRGHPGQGGARTPRRHRAGQGRRLRQARARCRCRRGWSSPGRSAPASTSTPSRTPGSSSRGRPRPTPKAQRAYAREILARVAGRAFRRPAGDATLDRLTDMALAGKTFEAGVAQAVTAVLSSPRFYYRAELQPSPDDPAAVHPLDEYALASRLSYLLWLSLPDDELTGLAAKGQLRKDLAAAAPADAGRPEGGAVLRGLRRPVAADAEHPARPGLRPGPGGRGPAPRR